MRLSFRRVQPGRALMREANAATMGQITGDFIRPGDEPVALCLLDRNG